MLAVCQQAAASVTRSSVFVHVKSCTSTFKTGRFADHENSQNGDLIASLVVAYHERSRARIKSKRAVSTIIHDIQYEWRATRATRLRASPPQASAAAAARSRYAGCSSEAAAAAATAAAARSSPLARSNYARSPPARWIVDSGGSEKSRQQQPAVAPCVVVVAAVVANDQRPHASERRRRQKNTRASPRPAPPQHKNTRARAIV